MFVIIGEKAEVWFVVHSYALIDSAKNEKPDHSIKRKSVDIGVPATVPITILTRFQP
jgi:hypothetical protein